VFARLHICCCEVAAVAYPHTVRTVQDTTKVVLELVRPLHRRDALQLLHELGEEHQPAEQVAVQSPDMLQAHVAHKVAEALLAGRESAIKYLEHAALRSSRRRSRHISIAFAAAAAALWLIWRLWLYGQFTVLQETLCTCACDAMTVYTIACRVSMANADSYGTGSQRAP
jgi:hypothetical protein